MPEFALIPITILAILVAITIHEWAHAFAAAKLGDDTARLAGRLTLNPIAHIDLLGAIFFLLAGFGWAKPVPVDTRNLRHPVRDSAIIAVAGPLSNLLLAFVLFVLALFLPFDASSVFARESLSASEAAWSIVSLFLAYSIRLNLALMAFNLLPIPPLDGSNILRLFIPWRYREQYDELQRYGMWILVALLIAESFLHVSILGAWVGGVTDGVEALFRWVFGR